MATKMGPIYANLFVSYIEHQFFNRPYIDGCVSASSSTREEINQFVLSGS